MKNYRENIYRSSLNTNLVNTTSKETFSDLFQGYT